jgi:DNA-binding transcriptional LysR family regulator
MLGITLQQIEYFLRVAETKFISEAANTLFVSQPAVSKWIDKLEKALGVRLFLRTRNGVVLTEEGKFLYSEWQPLYGKMCAAAQAVQHIHKPDEKVLRIGCLNSCEATNNLQDITRKIKEYAPDITVISELYDYVDLNQRLISGNIDMAISPSFALEGIPNISYKNISYADMYIAVSINHPLAGSESLQISDLKDELFYQLSHEVVKSGAVRAMEICVKAGFYPKRIQYVPNGSSLVMAIKQGNGVAICDKIIDERYEPDIRLFPINAKNIGNYISIAWRTNESSGLVRNLIGIFREI